MIRAAPGSVAVSYGGVDGYGLPELPPELAFQEPSLVGGKPVAVVAACYFPDIGVSKYDGQRNVNGTNIVVDDALHRISEVRRLSDDGGVVVLMLTDPA